MREDVLGSNDDEPYNDHTLSIDSGIQEVFDSVYADLVKDENFVISFFAALDHDEPSYTFSNGRSLEIYLAFEARSLESHNIIHHFIEQSTQTKPDQCVQTRIQNFIGLSLNRYPDLVRDGLEDGRTPLDMAVSAGHCLDIIQAICKSGIGKGATGFPGHGLNGVKAVGNVRADSGTSHTTTEEEQQDTKITWSDLVMKNHDTCLHRAIRKNNKVYAHYLLANIEELDAKDVVLGHFGQDDLTPLHLAVDFARCQNEQVKLVERLIDLYPKALTFVSGSYLQHQKANITGQMPYRSQRPDRWHETSQTELKENLTPYRYFMDTKEREQNSAPAPNPGRPGRRAQLVKPKPDLEEGKRMEEILRLSCMRHYGSQRSTITNLLPLSLGEIHFDLNPRTEVSQDLLNHMSKLVFEPYLQYVHIPNLRVVNMNMKTLETKPWWESSGRKDYVHIFEWLREKNVKRILKILVEDCPEDVHSDEVIEQAVASFDVEEWNWVKLDICSDTIQAAAPNVRDLSLYWSGNRAILRSWAAPDGLAQLKQLRNIRIMTSDPTESRERIDNMTEQFRHRFESSWRAREADDRFDAPHVDIQPVFTQSHVLKRLSEREREEKDRKEKWLKCMENFAQILKRAVNNWTHAGHTLSEKQEIKVAIIDDGLDIEKNDIMKNVDRGETFEDNKGYWPGFYQSAYGHGTLMAHEIQQICPKVRLYVAKLNEVWSNGKPQITARSAAQAIDWACENKVDIISMSWSIQTPEEVHLLEKAVKNALENKILLFCASNDQGNMSEIPYPAQVASEKIFKIGSATALGLRGKDVQRFVDFIAPGSEFVKGAASEDEKGFDEPRAGSSIATARCAGLAAVIIQCIMLHQPTESKEQVRSYEKMKAMLKALVDEGDTHKYLKVWKIFSKAVENTGLDVDFEWKAVCNIGRIFSAKAESLS